MNAHAMHAHFAALLVSAPPEWLDSRAFAEVRRGDLLTDLPATWREVYASRAHFYGLCARIEEARRG